jgi:excisionase family DNA binding protein
MEDLSGTYLTVTEAAKILKITDIRVQQLCQNGRLSAIKFARDWLIPRASVESYTPGRRGPHTKKEKLSGELAGIRAEIAAAKGEQPQ